eukprot:TRINITY_DN22755_c0_g2_i2.p1 TRINITY_DN22755_c0_g2~~TRINITY_DN22755_c0_g2_i2.p1  ORF type:complete len:699 (-),score=125.29 TRINITY_DN22755_c0_g2_i2:53-2050(-)
MADESTGTFFTPRDAATSAHLTPRDAFSTPRDTSTPRCFPAEDYSNHSVMTPQVGCTSSASTPCTNVGETSAKESPVSRRGCRVREHVAEEPTVQVDAGVPIGCSPSSISPNCGDNPLRRMPRPLAPRGEGGLLPPMPTITDDEPLPAEAPLPAMSATVKGKPPAAEVPTSLGNEQPWQSAMTVQASPKCSPRKSQQERLGPTLLSRPAFRGAPPLGYRVGTSPAHAASVAATSSVNPTAIPEQHAEVYDLAHDEHEEETSWWGSTTSPRMRRFLAGGGVETAAALEQVRLLDAARKEIGEYMEKARLRAEEGEAASSAWADTMQVKTEAAVNGLDSLVEKMAIARQDLEMLTGEVSQLRRSCVRERPPALSSLVLETGHAEVLSARSVTPRSPPRKASLGELRRAIDAAERRSLGRRCEERRCLDGEASDDILREFSGKGSDVATTATSSGNAVCSADGVAQTSTQVELREPGKTVSGATSCQGADVAMDDEDDCFQDSQLEQFRQALCIAEQQACVASEQRRIARNEAEAAIRNLEVCQSQLAQSRSAILDLERRVGELSTLGSRFSNGVAEAASHAVAMTGGDARADSALVGDPTKAEAAQSCPANSAAEHLARELLAVSSWVAAAEGARQEELRELSRRRGELESLRVRVGAEMCVTVGAN